MPELPEAETIARGLREPVAGRRVGRAEILRPDLVEGSAEGVRERVAGRPIAGVSRRGKNVVLHLGGEPELRLVVNLGMSGRLLHRTAGDPSPFPSHAGVVLHLDDGGCVVYDDARRFGRLRLLDLAGYRRWEGGLGPEPLGRSFTRRHLARILSGSVTPARNLLLDQRKVAGVGNIYASEALYRARIHPAARARAIPPARHAPLHAAIRAVLREAVHSGGTTLRDYRTAQGWEGSYQHRLRVYGREGAPCPRCATPIERIVFSARSAFLCPRCQPEIA